MLLLFTMACLLGVAEPYRAVVVDAQTRQPLPGVRITDLNTGQNFVTDAQGRLTLGVVPVHIRLNHVGYTPLEVRRRAPASGAADTLRLVAHRVELAEVRVRPTAPRIVSSVGAKPAKGRGGLVVPGGRCATQFPATAEDGRPLVAQLQIRFKPTKLTAGRVRVRVAAVAAGAPGVPGSQDLLPATWLYTAAERAALPDQLLTIDLTPYQFRLPATPFCVVLEGLPSDPAEKALVLRDDPTPYLIITATDPANPATYRRTEMNNFPAVATVASITASETRWQHGSSDWGKPMVNYKSHKPENADIRLILADE